MSPQKRWQTEVGEAAGIRRSGDGSEFGGAGTLIEVEAQESRVKVEGIKALVRIGWFFAMFAVVLCATGAMVNTGLKRLQTGQFGAWNRMMSGEANADIVISGSSRALMHYDPRVIRALTGRTAFNIGRNGSQTDMQIAVLKAYLEHNRKPVAVIHNLDAFSFETTREVFDPAQYVPYLADEELYRPLRQINPETWKSRYLPLYGYVVDDMNFTWMDGIRGLFGWSAQETFYDGFNPRYTEWSGEFESFKRDNPRGVSWPIEPQAIGLVDGLIRLCAQQNIQLILVYSPEYTAMQQLTNNRAEVFGHFRDLSDRRGVPFWDYSDWEHAADTTYFTNSQHLNVRGAETFSRDLGRRLADYFEAGVAASR